MSLLLHHCVQFRHGDLLGPLHGYGHLLLVLSREEGKNLTDDSIESLADLSLFVHLHVQPV